MATTSWRAEFPRGFEIPGFIDFLIRKGLILDLSWHNDAMPSFGILGGRLARKHWDPRQAAPEEQPEPEVDVRLWVDHPFKEYREVGGKRFMVSVGEYASAPEESAEYDELEDAMSKLFEFGAKVHSEGRTLDPVAFSVTLEEADNDWKELLNELVEEYHTGRRP